MTLRADVTPEAVITLRLAAENMPLAWEGGPWSGAADWLLHRANCFEAALAGSTRTCGTCGRPVVDCGHEPTDTHPIAAVVVAGAGEQQEEA